MVLIGAATDDLAVDGRIVLVLGNEGSHKRLCQRRDGEERDGELENVGFYTTINGREKI
jgi:hypothetical protein